ncbi:MAG: YkgJ family cysteine cluster protein [Thermacetogeniaceae bacterium]
MEKGVRVLWDEEFGCYDVVVLNGEATVGDFEEECREILDGERVRKRYSDSCIGCSICCSERIPVTLVDVVRILEVGVGDVQAEGLAKQAHEIVDIERYGDCIDVRLKVDEWGICRFWRKDEGKCSIYENRPIACSTYVCVPVSWRFEELRTQVINRGQDDLISFLCEGRWEAHVEMSYRGIRIRDVCTKRLWRALTKRD